VRNPSFDVTPAELISGIITDEGVLRAPYEVSVAEAVEGRAGRRAQTPSFAQLAASSAQATPVPASTVEVDA
jgi:hypothetical protein